MANIVHVLSGLEVGGKERVALNLAQSAMRDGHCVSLLLYDTPFRSDTQDFNPGNVPTHHLRRGPGLDLRFAILLGRHFRNSRADVVHAHNDTALFYTALAAASVIPGPPKIIATFHVWPTEGGKIAQWLARTAGKFATVTAVSDDLARRLIIAGWLFRCEVVWNGVDTALYTPAGPTCGWRERLGVGRLDFLVGHIARFDPVKRHADLLKAALRLRRERPDIVFVLVGQGPLQEEVRSQAAELPNVRFMPQVADMPPLLRSLDALVLCSAHEASPLSLLEGMACGLSVVATAVGGIPHILQPSEDSERSGLLVQPGNPDLLAEAILLLASDDAMRQRLGKAARHRALDFTLEEQWKTYATLYNRERRATSWKLF